VKTGYPAAVTTPPPNAGQAGDLAPSPSHPDARVAIADRFLQGRGLLVGAGAGATELGPTATAREVDAAGLKAAAVASQDFIVDSELPAEAGLQAAIEARFVKLAPGGVLFCTVPEADLPTFLAARPERSEAEIAIAPGGDEVAVAIRKPGPRGEPAAGQQTPEVAAEVRELRALVARLERELETTGRELGRVKQSSSWRVTEPLRAAKARLGGRS
jgi:hypothetical protein